MVFQTKPRCGTHLGPATLATFIPVIRGNVALIPAKRLSAFASMAHDTMYIVTT